MVDALAFAVDERRERLRYASGSRQLGYDPRISEWGNPAAFVRSRCTESIGVSRQPGELKHLSTQWKGNQTRDSLSSGERTGTSPNRMSVKLTGVAHWGL